MLQAAKSSSTRQFRRWAPVMDCYATVCVMFYVFDVLFLFQCFYACGTAALDTNLSNSQLKQCSIITHYYPFIINYSVSRDNTLS